LTSHAELQIASLFHTPCSHICVNFIDVPTQSGDSECGIFAIAYATALSLKQDPGKIEFAESGLRNHLYKSLKNRKMTIFPVLRRKRSIRIKRTENIKIYCQCRLPEIGPMLECSWFQLVPCVHLCETLKKHHQLSLVLSKLCFCSLNPLNQLHMHILN